MAKTKKKAIGAKKAARTKAGRGKKGGAGKGAAARRPAKPTAPARPRRAPSASPARAGPDEARPTAIAVAKAALDKKAEDVLVLDVRGLTSYADYFVVMTAESERQASAIADHVDDQLKKLGHRKVGVEGYESGRWILVDYGDVVAHVMNPESRGFYDLEGLWADAPRFRVDG